MALIRRTAVAALAGVALAAAAVTPASAYWRASGGGAGTVAVSAAAPRLLTLALTNGTGRSVKASGTAGYNAPYNAAVSVVLCRVQTTWPCPTASIAATLTTTAGPGAPSYSVSSGNLNGITVWAMASQAQASNWKDYSTVAGPITG
jgi:hypothetical protein